VDAAVPQAVIAVERAPADATWIDQCNEGVILMRHEVFDVAVTALDDRN
jgi:hypothetical protein